MGNYNDLNTNKKYKVLFVCLGYMHGVNCYFGFHLFLFAYLHYFIL